MFVTLMLGSDISVKQCNTGELVVLETNWPACWDAEPSEYLRSIRVFNEGKTCVFASPKPGKVTIRALGLQLETNTLNRALHTVFNGVKPDLPVDD